MVERVLDALRAVPAIGRVVVVGPDPLPRRVAQGADAVVADRGTLVDNVAAGLEAAGGDEPVLVVSADLPLLTPEAVTAFLDAASALEGDVFYAVVRHDEVARAFPGVRKTAVRLRDGTFTGGSVVLIRPEAFARARAVIARAAGARKRPWELAGLFGARTLLRVLTRRATVAELERRAWEITGVRARAVICPYPELAVDVDRRETAEAVRSRLDVPGPAPGGELDPL